MKKTTHFIVLLIIVIISACSTPPHKKAQAVVNMIQGNPVLDRKGKKYILKKGIGLKSGDKIITSKSDTAIISIRDNIAQVEIQPDAIFMIGNYTTVKKQLTLLTGNIWVKVKKLQDNQRLTLWTPTSVAGVRGTKFYTFSIDGLYGTCHCEGSVHYITEKTKYEGIHDTDDLVVTKNKKTILFTAEELKKNTGVVHDHSTLDNSPLGKKSKAANDEKVFKYIKKRFAQEQ
jgi:hypothetical protein